MAGVTIGLKIDDADVQAMFDRAPAAVTARIRRLIEAGAIDIQREMRQAAPIAVTGQLRRSVQYTLDPLALKATIWPDVNYAVDVERGRRPGMVSVAEGTPLRKWAQLKGINPFALQHSIAKKGTQAHPFVEPTFQKMEPKVSADITDGLAKLVEDLVDGTV